MTDLKINNYYPKKDTKVNNVNNVQIMTFYFLDSPNQIKSFIDDTGVSIFNFFLLFFIDKPDLGLNTIIICHKITVILE